MHVAGKRRVIQVPDPKRAKFFIAMFELRAAGELTDIEIVERINAMGFRTKVCHRWDPSHQRIIGQRGGNLLSVKRFQEIIQRPIYCGVVWEKWTNWRPVKAAYDGLVSIETWNAANRGKRFIERTEDGIQLLHDMSTKRLNRFYDRDNPLYPFKGVILCPSCRKPFLGSASRSRSGKRVPAYHCAREHSRVARNKAAFERAVGSFIEQLHFEPEVANVAFEALHGLFHERKDELQFVATETARAVADLEAEKVETVRAFKGATSDLMRRALETDLERLDVQITNGGVQQRQSELSDADFERYLRDLGEIMEHPAILLEKPVNPRVQRSRFDVAFAQLPTLYEIENGTAELSPILKVCDGEDNPESVRVRLRGLTWNQIRCEILRNKNLDDDRSVNPP